MVLPCPFKSMSAGRDTAKSSYMFAATEKHEKEELAHAEPSPAGQGRRGGSQG